MRKFFQFLIVVAFVSNFSYAGTNNYASIEDMKDALYYLIKDYQKLSKQSGNNSKEISKIDKNITKMMKDIQTLKVEIKPFQEKRTVCDDIIDGFVKKNQKILVEFKKSN